MRIHKLALTVAVALSASAPVLAQQQHHPPGAQHPDMAALHCGGMAGMMHEMPGQRGMADKEPGGMMHGMMMGPPTPAMLLRHKDELALSDEQVTQLGVMQQQAQPACAQHMQMGMAAWQAANQMLEASAPDFAAYSAKLKEATAHLVEARVVMAKAAVAAREVLTPAQRQKCADMMKQMHKKP